MGINGRERIEVMIKIGKRGVGFTLSNCHFILVLLNDGNRVRDVE